MSYVVEIKEDELIDALEEQLRDVYENINEGDKVTEVYMRGDKVFIVIGE